MCGGGGAKGLFLGSASGSDFSTQLSCICTQRTHTCSGKEGGGISDKYLMNIHLLYWRASSGSL